MRFAPGVGFDTKVSESASAGSSSLKSRKVKPMKDQHDEMYETFSYECDCCCCRGRCSDDGTGADADCPTLDPDDFDSDTDDY